MNISKATEQEELIYRGYPIVKEATREWRISCYAIGLKTAKKVIDWMIYQGCLEDEGETEK